MPSFLAGVSENHSMLQMSLPHFMAAYRRDVSSHIWGYLTNISISDKRLLNNQPR